jgi:hypothetical protein
LVDNISLERWVVVLRCRNYRSAWLEYNKLFNKFFFIKLLDISSTNTSMFQKLTDKQIAAVQKHKAAHGTRSANVFRASLMRGRSLKEAKKIADERTPNLPPRRARRKPAGSEDPPAEAKGDEVKNISEPVAEEIQSE